MFSDTLSCSLTTDFNGIGLGSVDFV
jgi:hypothetical protein